MRKTLLFCGLFTFAAFSLNSCDDDEENTPTEVKLTTEFVGRSGCLGSAFGSSVDDAVDSYDKAIIPYISYKYDTKSKEVELVMNNIVAACDADMKMNVNVNGDTLTLVPYLTNESIADCMCTFNLTSKIKGALAKAYYIKLHSQDPNERIIDLAKNTEGVIYLDE